MLIELLLIFLNGIIYDDFLIDLINKHFKLLLHLFYILLFILIYQVNQHLLHLTYIMKNIMLIMDSFLMKVLDTLYINFLIN